MSGKKLDKRKLFNELVKLCTTLFPKRTQSIVQREVGEFWEKIKSYCSDETAFLRAADDLRTKWKQKPSHNKL